MKTKSITIVDDGELLSAIRSAFETAGSSDGDDIADNLDEFTYEKIQAAIGADTDSMDAEDIVLISVDADQVLVDPFALHSPMYTYRLTVKWDEA